MPGLIGSALIGAAGGLGDEIQTQAHGAIEDSRKVDLAAELSKIQEEKELRVAKSLQGLKYDDDLKRSDPNSELFKNDLEGKKQTGILKGEIDRTNSAALGQDSKALAGMAAEARAKHVDGAGSLAQADLAKFQLENAKVLNGLQTQLSNTNDPAEQTKIQKQINGLTYSIDQTTKEQTAKINQYKIDEAEEIKGLWGQYKQETDPAKKTAIAEYIQFRTGKDNDNYKVVKGGIGEPDTIINSKTGRPPDWAQTKQPQSNVKPNPAAKYRQ